MTATLLISQPDHGRARASFVVAEPLQNSVGHQTSLPLEFIGRIDHCQTAPIEPVWICRGPQIEFHRHDVTDAGRLQAGMKASDRGHLLDWIPRGKNPMAEAVMAPAKPLQECQELIPCLKWRIDE